jgi:metal-sulfur cluster biosynthetic enzyme
MKMAAFTASTLTIEDAYDRLRKVMDPELNIDIVSLGLVYDVTIRPIQSPLGKRTHVHILLTLTTPGCPLAAMFDTLVKDAFIGIRDLEAQCDVTVELTFDPPWVPDMMSEEAKAELGY